MQTEEKAGSWNYKITSLLLHSLSVIASYLVPFSLCAVILPCTDADQMEDWKMKGATDEEEGRKKKDGGGESQEGRLSERDVFSRPWLKTETGWAVNGAKTHWWKNALHQVWRNKSEGGGALY